MNIPLVEDQVFEQVDFTVKKLPQADYEYCRFINCRLFQADLRSFRFLETEFIGCDLSLSQLSDTAFKGVRFKECKLTGLAFDQCNQFGLNLSFEGSNLTHSSFYRLPLKTTLFKNCILEEVEFREANLTGAVFTGSRLTNAQFDQTILEKADLRGASEFNIDPSINPMKKAKFSASTLAGLLHRFQLDIDYHS